LWILATGLTLTVAAFPASPVTIDPTIEKSIRSFFSTYCTECHGPEKQKGDRRFDQLKLPIAHPDTLIELQDAIDQLNLGEMPPAKAKRHPDEGEARAMIERLTQLVSEGHARLASTGGQTCCGGSIAASTSTRSAISLG
jgi:hypothetical protein